VSEHTRTDHQHRDHADAVITGNDLVNEIYQAGYGYLVEKYTPRKDASQRGIENAIAALNNAYPFVSHPPFCTVLAKLKTTSRRVSVGFDGLLPTPGSSLFFFFFILSLF
jgi:hypothetical protein